MITPMFSVKLKQANFLRIAHMTSRSLWKKEPLLHRSQWCTLSPSELETLREFIDENLRNGFIRTTSSLHGAPVLFIFNNNGSLRLCVDYRGLQVNRISKKDWYPLPLISDLLAMAGKARIYTTLDLRHAYHLVRIAEGGKCRDHPSGNFEESYLAIWAAKMHCRWSSALWTGYHIVGQLIMWHIEKQC